MSLGPRIDVHIEELVLHGFQPSDRRAIADAIASEVTRVLAQPGAVLTHDRRIPRIDAGQVQWEAGGGARRIGAEVARAVGSGLVPRASKP